MQKNKQESRINLVKYEGLLKLGEIKVEYSSLFIPMWKFLCIQYSEVEWSGILQFTLKGDVKKGLENCTITLNEIFPMNVGTTSYTEYAFDSQATRWLNNKLKDPVFLESKSKGEAIEGHIHSHNNMKVFFSGTDDRELYDNTPEYNLYLSIIVNNAGDITGRLCTTVTSEMTGTKMQLQDGSWLKKKGISNKVNRLGYYKCIFPKTKDVLPEWFIERSKEIAPKKYEPRYPPVTSRGGIHSVSKSSSVDLELVETDVDLLEDIMNLSEIISMKTEGGFKARVKLLLEIGKEHFEDKYKGILKTVGETYVDKIAETCEVAWIPISNQLEFPLEEELEYFESSLVRIVMAIREYKHISPILAAMLEEGIRMEISIDKDKQLKNDYTTI